MTGGFIKIESINKFNLNHISLELLVLNKILNKKKIFSLYSTARNPIKRDKS